MTRVALFIFGYLVLAAACGDGAATPDAGVDARLEGFEAPELVCPGGAGCETGGTGALEVGVGKRAWTPLNFETFTDENNDREYSNNEPYTDLNGNGKFDGVWLFGGARAAQAVMTDVEARAIAFSQGDTLIVVLSLDSIGILASDMDKIRNHPALTGLPIDHVIISSSHAHEAPDTMGLWGPTVVTTGRQKFVLERLYAQSADAIKEAVASLQPAHLTIASTKLINDPTNTQSRTDDFNKDIRDPVIFDPTLTIARFTKAGQPTQTIATLVNWADHPEVARDDDIPASITAHYPHYLRAGIEDGVLAANTKYTTTDLPGLGGVAVFVQGALGGQIGSLRGTHPPGPGGTPITVLSHAMERAIGTNAAALALKALATTGETVSDLPLSFKTAVFHGRIENTFLHVAFLVGLLGTAAETEEVLVGYNPVDPIDTGNFPWLQMRSSYLQVGPLGMITAPGELHPELWVGGYDGSWSWGWPLFDPTKPNLPKFDEAPAPPYMRDLVLAHPGVRYPICAGLAENYVGYIVPAYNYVLDPSDPYIVEAEGDHYEEVYSLSPFVEQHAVHPILELLRYRSP